MKSQDRILIFISDFVQEKSFAPSFREIGEGVGLKSTSSVHGHCHVLKTRKLLNFQPELPRTFSLTEKGKERVEELKK